jgi:prepilin-type processing-associated H-X9-DG protein/prepilin-type N-terminal cleavage/methylation domain-containing protein
MKSSIKARRSGARGNFSFTLIELLVVIAIIAILAALLAPALRSARLSALDVKCASNQRQIHMGIYLYAQDHDQTYPVITWDTQYNQLLYFSNYIGLTFYRCPLATEKLQDDAFWGPKYSVVIDGVQHWTEYKIGDDPAVLLGKPLGSQLRPNKVVYVIDSADWAPRHRGKANLCFGDGHVEAMTYLQYNDAGNAPEPGSPTGNPKPWYAWGLYDY